MSISKILKQLFGVPRYPAAKDRCSHYRDSDIGDFDFDPVIGAWTQWRVTERGRLLVLGRSEKPTQDQKALLDFFLPKLPELSKATARSIRMPGGCAYGVPPDLVPDQIRFEPTGLVGIFFNYPLTIDGVDVWPLATFSPEGTLLSIDWEP